jgi:hypothetical protein
METQQNGSKWALGIISNGDIFKQIRSICAMRELLAAAELAGKECIGGNTDV